MIKAVIVEDEDFAVERLQMILNEIDDSVEVIQVLNSIKSAVRWLSMNSPDLIFLDINLADGNAFKIFEQVEIKTPIIFTTAYHDYALRAFEQCSIDYLLKPINREKLKNALSKLNILRDSRGEVSQQDIQELIQLMKLGEDHLNKRFMINVGNKVKVVESTDVVCFTAESKITFLQTFDEKRYPIDNSLKQLELLLPQQSFFRVNRQYLVNREAIKELQYFSATHLIVILDPPSKEDIIVAREKIGLFKRWLA